MVALRGSNKVNLSLMATKLASEISMLKKKMEKLEAKFDKMANKTAVSQKKKKSGINGSKSKKDLEEYTLPELKEFIKKNKIDTSKMKANIKKNYINLIWEYLQLDSDLEDLEAIDSEEDGDDDDGWEYYY